MQGTQTVPSKPGLWLVVLPNWDWLIYPAAILLGLSLGAFLALL
ncbi:MAG: hypothetical protein ACLFTP_00965 [Rhodosalinus sp.]